MDDYRAAVNFPHVIPAICPAILAIYSIIPARSPVIPAKAGIQKAADAIWIRPRARYGGIFGYGEKRKPGESES